MLQVNGCEMPNNLNSLHAFLAPAFPLTIAALLTDHFDYIKKVAGAEIIGFGGDYDGVTR